MLIIALQAILLGSLLYQRAASLADARRLPPPGERLEVGDQWHHIDCRGEGSPTVVFLSGLPRTSIDWRLVQPELAQVLRSCTYDRAGYAWSERGPNPRSATRLADELDQLLIEAEIEGPLILVAHEWGALVARIFQAEHPDRVQGMVLVQGMHPDRVDRMTADEREYWDERIEHLRCLGYLEMLGLTRLARPLLMADYDERTRLAPLPAEAKAELEAAFVRTGFFRTAYAEASVWPASFDAARQAGSLGDLPLIVLSAGQEVSERERALQAELAQLSSRGRLVEVAESDAYIMLFAPERVIEAVLELGASAP